MYAYVYVLCDSDCGCRPTFTLLYVRTSNAANIALFQIKDSECEEDPGGSSNSFRLLP